MTYAEVSRHATKLPRKQQLKLASKLLGLQEEDSSAEEAWDKETRRRMAEYRSGKACMVSSEEVMRGIAKKFGK